MFSRSSGVVAVGCAALPLVLAGAGRATPATPQDHAISAAATVSVGRADPMVPGHEGRIARSATRTQHRTPVRMAPAPLPVAVATPSAARSLAASLDAALRSRSRSGRWGVLVMSVSRGDTLYSEEPDRPLKPASTMKLMTTALALERLGVGHTFATEVLADGPASGGVIAGNVYLRGGGDPTLSLRFWHRASPMDELARQLKASGVTRVHGDVVADESAFTPERIPLGWKSKNLASAYAAPVSALSLNENLVWVDTRVVDGNAVVTIDPPSAAYTVSNTVRVIDGRGGRVLVGRTRTGVIASGTIGAESRPRRYSLVVPDPPAFAAGALVASLRKAGIAVDGAIRVGTAPRNAVRVAESRSPRLDSIVSVMNRESINHFAELIFRSAAREPGRAGSATAALESLRGFLDGRVGVRRDDIRVRDGSGLSEADTLTARSLVQVLAYANHAPWSSAYHMSLPVAGQSDLLRRRFRATLAQGNLHAKTGSTNSVTSLAGYVTARNGELLAFAFLYNGRDLWNARAAMDRMGVAMANFYREQRN